MAKNKRKDTTLKKSPIQMAIENNSCGKCRKNGLPNCMGHTESGGGGSGGGSEDSDLKNDGVSDALTKLYLDKHSPIIDFSTPTLKLTFNSVCGTMTLGAANHKLSAEELSYLKEYLSRVEKTFIEFKKELAEKGISTKDFVHSLADNNTKLLIKIPSPTHYAAFIRKLAENNLLPSPYLALKLRDEVEASQPYKRPRNVPKGHVE